MADIRETTGNHHVFTFSVQEQADSLVPSRKEK
jgi:hypothetical protein